MTIKEIQVRLKRWKNKMGHDVFLGENLLATVASDPAQPGMVVTTFLDEDTPDLRLELPKKMPPLDAVQACFDRGKPVTPERPPNRAIGKRFNIDEFRQRHPGMLILVRDGDLISAGGPEEEKVLGKVAGVVSPFSRHALERVLKDVLRAGHRVAFAESNEKGGK